MTENMNQLYDKLNLSDFVHLCNSPKFVYMNTNDTIMYNTLLNGTHQVFAIYYDKLFNYDSFFNYLYKIYIDTSDKHSCSDVCVEFTRAWRSNSSFETLSKCSLANIRQTIMNTSQKIVKFNTDIKIAETINELVK